VHGGILEQANLVALCNQAMNHTNSSIHTVLFQQTKEGHGELEQVVVEQEAEHIFRLQLCERKRDGTRLGRGARHMREARCKGQR
jgi:hypothetical protein